jgi:hypothetical protein
MDTAMTVTFQEWIEPTLVDPTLAMYSQVSALGIAKDFNILSFQSFANLEGLAEQMDIAVRLPKRYR